MIGKLRIKNQICSIENYLDSPNPDGKYIQFNRYIDDGGNNENMNVDIYWVDAQINEQLRPKK